MSENKGMAVLKDMVNSDYVKARFAEVMGEKAPAFLASVLNATRTNPALKDCDPNSVISAAMVAASLDLPIDGSLGFAALVPYKNKGQAVAQFQIMTKGYVQLALRTGQYKTINVGPVYADEFGGFDIITGEVKITPVDGGFRSKDDDSKIVGYVAFFRLVNGYECTRYWPMEKIIAHGRKYSKSFGKEYGLWKTDLSAMAAKTVLKNTLSKWGILSTSMQMALRADQGVVKGYDKPANEQDIEYVDAPDQESATPIDPEQIVKLADNTKPSDDFQLTGDPEPETAETLWIKLVDLMKDKNLPAAARKEIQEANANDEKDPVKLAALLAKATAAIL